MKGLAVGLLVLLAAPLGAWAHDDTGALEHTGTIAAPSTTDTTTGESTTDGTFDDQILPELAEDEPTAWWLAILLGIVTVVLAVIVAAVLRSRRPPG